MVCKTFKEFIKDKKYLQYNITKLDYELYKKVSIFSSQFLYYVCDYELAKRYIELFDFYYENFKPMYDHMNASQIRYVNNFIRKGIRINRTTPVHMAIVGKQYKIVELFINSANCINSIDALSNTPLITAVEYGYEEILELLLKHKDININTKDYLGMTALFSAARYGKIPFVKTLLDYGADPNIKCTALNKTAIYTGSRWKHIVKLLLDKSNLDDDIIEEIDESLWFYPEDPDLMASKKMILEEMARRSA